MRYDKYELAITISGPRGVVQIKRSQLRPKELLVVLDGRECTETVRYPIGFEELDRAACDIVQCLEPSPDPDRVSTKVDRIVRLLSAFVPGGTSSGYAPEPGQEDDVF